MSEPRSQHALTSEQLAALVLPAARRDVDSSQQLFHGQPCYVIKDPVTLRYYRLELPAYFIFTMLDGQRNMAEILRKLEERFPQQQFTQEEMLAYVDMLRQAQLLRIGGEQSEKLLTAGRETRKKRIKAQMASFLWLRIPLIDPDRILNVLYRMVRFLFTPATVVAALALLSVAIFLVVKNFEQILNPPYPLISARNAILMAIVFALTKVVHEFGHGLICKHYGGEVHEMGILLMVFMPMAYCEVSDSWMLARKRDRLWIIAGGVAFEMVLASLATIIWASVSDGIVRQLALNLMILSSISSLLFNANPLLRYDGYYFLMDWVEIPNLRTKATGYVNYLMQRYLLGMEVQKPLDVEGRETFMAIYSVLAIAYRWLVLFGIILLVYNFLPESFQWLGALMAFSCAFNQFIWPPIKGIKFLSKHHARIRMRWGPTLGSALALIAIVAGILMIPLRRSITHQCIIEPEQLHNIFVKTAGFVESIRVPGGQQVAPGDLLVVLDDPQLRADLVLAKEGVQQARIRSDLAISEGEVAKAQSFDEEAKRAGEQVLQLQRQVDELQIRVPTGADGKIITERLELRVGEYLDRGQLWCRIQGEGPMVARMALDAHQMGRLHSGTDYPVRIRLWSLADEKLKGTLDSLPQGPVDVLSNASFAGNLGGEVPAKPDLSSPDQTQWQPLETTYEAIVNINNSNELLTMGMVGRSRIDLQRDTVGQLLYDWVIKKISLGLRL